MPAFFLPLALLVSVAGEPSPPTWPLLIPAPARETGGTVEIRVSPERATFPVAAGTRMAARFQGSLVVPPTDPGRTVVRLELIDPLLARNGRTTLLPAGTRLLGLVHLLRGEFRFIDFQSCMLPDGRSLGLPEGVFHLGPGSLLTIQDGAPVMVTVARPLRMESFGTAP